MKTADTLPAATRRDVMLHDGVAFLVLTLATLALYGVTMLLFRSFQRHRDDLGRQWSERGRDALRRGDPTEAVTALRAALTYAPEDREDQLRLAEALAGAGHTDEANSYFLNLWESRPGDGFINLQLARLAARKDMVQQAVDFYRASIFGTWPGDGVTRRRDVRLELAEFLLAHHDAPAARAEILVAAGNAPADARLNLLFGDRLEQAGDVGGALDLYRKAMEDDPHSSIPPAKAGRAAYALGEYATAERMLEDALRKQPPAADRPGLAALAGDAARLRQLSLSPELPVGTRAEHLRLASGIAQSRLRACLAQAAPESTLPALAARWKTLAGPAGRRALASVPATQDTVAELITETETGTARLCAAPGGDDALLLHLAQHPEHREDGSADGR